MQHQSISLPISRTTEYGFSFIETIPLDDRFQDTPMWENAPRAPVELSRDNGFLQWKVLRCPYCARMHYHNIDDGEDPRLFLGGRCSHCLPIVPEDPRGLTEYRLIPIVGNPTIEGLNHYFPIWWNVGWFPPTQNHRRTTFSQRIKQKVWRKSEGHCWYCGDELDPFTDFEIDHFLSLKNGGSNKVENLVPSCKWCNARKSHWHVEIFRTRHLPKLRFWFEQEDNSFPFTFAYSRKDILTAKDRGEPR